MEAKEGKTKILIVGFYYTKNSSFRKKILKERVWVYQEVGFEKKQV